MKLDITSPDERRTIDLAKTPEFDVQGRLSGDKRRSVVAVDLYGDGRLIGSADPQRRDRHRWWKDDFWWRDAEWGITTSSSAGAHTLVACARTARGTVVAAASLHINVKAPAPTATVVDPDVLVADKSLLGRITDVTADGITTGKPDSRLQPGTVLVAGVSPKTPYGLMRRIVSASGNRYKTVQASLTDIYLQASIKLPTPALPAAAKTAQPAAGTVTAAAGAPKALAAGAFASVGAGGCASAAATVAGAPFAVAVGCAVEYHLRSGGVADITEKIDVKGTISADASLSATGLLYPILDIDIRTTWKFGILPVPTLVRANVGLAGSLSASGSAKLDGEGSISYTKENIFGIGPKILGPFEILTPLPMVLTPVVSLDTEFGAETEIKAEFNAQASINATVSAQYDDTGWHNTSTSGGSGSATPIGKVGTGKASVSATVVPRAALLIDFVLGPEVSAGVGLKYQVKYPCPGFAKADVIVAPSIRGASPFPTIDDIFEKLEYKGDVSLKSLLPDSTKAPGCGDVAIDTTGLPDGTVGLHYELEAAAHGGKPDYVWAATGLPPGLGISADGLISGTPTTAGTYKVSLGVADANGATAIVDLPLVVGPALPAVPTTPAPAPPAQPVACTATVHCGSSYGDPHLVTPDGAYYDFQQVGEFVALRSDTDDMEVQVRQRPWFQTSRTVAENSAVAMKVAGHRVGIYRTAGDPQILVDGVAVTPGASPYTLPGGGSITAGQGAVTVQWPDGSFVTVYAAGYFRVSVGLAAARAGHVHGLFGNADGVAGNDFATRDGTAIAYPPKTADLYGPFAGSWRVAQAESLFDYAAGTDTNTFTDKAFPYAVLGVGSLPAATHDQAAALCIAAGASTQPFLDACILDVALTGDVKTVTDAAGAQAFTGGGGAPAQVKADYTGPMHNTTYNINSTWQLTGVTETADGTISGQAVIVPPLYGSGPFTGKVTATTITFRINSDPGNPCACVWIDFTGTIAADGTMSGSYVTHPSFGAPQNGTWALAPKTS
ncbi:MAG TPA: VWD domain-containing protein [Dactylosporangium sp.]|nr:VWD domain-containing protein [Dactylosporangium sp.]